jgi:zinc finger protein
MWLQWSLSTPKTSSKNQPFQVYHPKTKNLNEEMSSFIAADTFSGAKPNYKFQQGDQGIGYYLDVDTQPLLVSIDVPVGAGPGDVLEIQHPNTQDWVKVTLPEGSTSGTPVQVNLNPRSTTPEVAPTKTNTETETEEISVQMPIGKQVALGGAAIQTINNSMCVECQGVGVTHLLPTVIPYFKEIIVVSFKCNDCGWTNTETMETSEVQPKGSRIAFTASTQEDLNRRIIKSKHAVIEIKELELTIPAMTQRGTMTTIEGLLQKTIDHLRQDQDRRREEHPELAAKLDDFISSMVLYATGLSLPFTLILDDPTGNSHIENPKAPNWDPNMRTSNYVRTKPQNIMIGMSHLNDIKEDRKEGNESKTNNMLNDNEMTETKIRDQSNAKREGWIDFDRAAGGEDKIAEKKLVQLPMDCPACGKEGGHMNSCQTNIPHFKDIVILAFSCDECGYRTNEIKAGGGVPLKGRRWTLTVSGTKPEDMHRDVLKSNTARVSIKELGFEMEPGSLGGVYTTTEGKSWE